MRVLIVNPNTSQGVTARIDAAARAVAAPGDRFTTVSAAFGPALIVTEADAEEATAGVLRVIADHIATAGAPDGIVLASFGDTGAAEVRAALPAMPVIGIAEAAFATARRIGGPFAIVTFAPEVAPPLRAKAEALGVGAQLAQVRALPGPLACPPAEIADRLGAALTALCHEVAGDGVVSIVLGGGPLAGLAARIAPHCPVPVIDGTQEAIAHLRETHAARADSVQAQR
jgi:Asp/Glu/hydantoin racemase